MSSAHDPLLLSAPLPGSLEEGDLRAALIPPVVAPPRQGALTAILVCMLVAMAAAVAAILWFLLFAPADAPAPSRDAVAQSLPLTAAEIAAARALPLPPSSGEPVTYLEVTRDAARALNAAVPFSTEPNPPAAPLNLVRMPADEARAADCLAAAVWYEAGDDPVGERAVAQVVVNRLRHRAFPKSVCGVVFEGAERRTGCQFSFTCDGSMVRRRPGPAAWARARAIATAAMHGSVFAGLGWATHYHTDWVVPNWSRDVDKLARVGTHLFFRWRGGNGRRAAFANRPAEQEPVVPTLGPLSPAHVAGAGEPVLPVAPAPGDAAPVVSAAPAAPAAADLKGNRLTGGDAEAGLFVVDITPDQFSGSLAVMAVSMCKGRSGACTVVGFRGGAGRVLRDALGRTSFPDKAPDFHYFRDPRRGREAAAWNCSVFPRADPRQCIGTASALE